MDTLIIVGVAALVGGLIFLLVRGGGVPAAGGGCCGGGGHGAKGQHKDNQAPRRQETAQPEAAATGGCCGDAVERAVQDERAGSAGESESRQGGCH